MLQPSAHRLFGLRLQRPHRPCSAEHVLFLQKGYSGVERRRVRLDLATSVSTVDLPTRQFCSPAIVHELQLTVGFISFSVSNASDCGQAKLITHGRPEQLLQAIQSVLFGRGQLPR